MDARKGRWPAMIRMFKANLGDMAIAGLVISVFLAFMVMGLGGIAVNNNLNLPGPVNTLFYNLTNGQPTNFTDAQQNLMNTSQSAANQEQSSGFFSPITNAYNSVGVAVTFITKIPALFVGFINFIAQALSYAGVPTTMTSTVAWTIMILIIALIILSALFIFPLLRSNG
jgi:hypothetical protein